jgi:hypothetical protein
MSHDYPVRRRGGESGDSMGVDGCLGHCRLSVDELAVALELEEHEILFSSHRSGECSVDDEPELGLVLLTDERGFLRRASSFAPESRTRTRREHRRVGMIYTHVGGVDLDVEVHLRSTYEELLRTLEAWSPEADERESAPECPPRDTAVELLFQLGGGRAVVHCQAFEELRARLDLRKLSAWNVHRALLRGQEAIASAAQSLRRSDAENAYLKLSAAYDALGDAVLFARGAGADRSRWTLQTLRTLGPSPFLERYLDVMLVRRGPSEPLSAFVARQLDAAESVADRLRRDASSALA